MEPPSANEDESDSEGSIESNDSASNEGNADTSYFFIEHPAQNNGDVTSKVTCSLVPEISQLIPTNTTATTERFDSLGALVLEDHGPAQCESENAPDTEKTEEPNGSASNEENGDTTSYIVVEHPRQKGDHERTETTRHSICDTSQSASNEAPTQMTFEALNESSLAKNAETLECVGVKNAPDTPNENSPTLNEETTQNNEASCVVGAPIEYVKPPAENSGDAEKSADTNQVQTPETEEMGCTSPILHHENSTNSQDTGEDVHPDVSATSTASTVTIDCETKDSSNVHAVEEPAMEVNALVHPESNAQAETTSEHFVSEVCFNPAESNEKLLENSQVLSKLEVMAREPTYVEPRPRFHSSAVDKRFESSSDNFSSGAATDETASLQILMDQGDTDPTQMKYKRRNSMADSDNIVPECKKQEMDSPPDAEEMTGSLRRSASETGGSQVIADNAREVNEEVDNDGSAKTTTDFALYDTIVPLTRLNLVEKNPTNGESTFSEFANTSLKDSTALEQPETANDTKDQIDHHHHNEEIEPKKGNEDVPIHDNNVTLPDETDSEQDSWNWSFRTSSSFEKFRENGQQLYYGVGSYLKKKNKERPLYFKFFPAVTQTDDDDSQIVCNVKIPFAVYEEFDYFYAFFCIVREDKSRQRFENLIASNEHRTIENATSQRSEDLGLIKLAENSEKPKAETKSVSGASNKKAKEQLATEKNADDEQSSASDEEMTVDEIVELKSVIGNKNSDCVESVNGNVLVLNAIFGDDILALGCPRLLICVATSLNGFKKPRAGVIVSSFDKSLWLQFHVPLNRSSTDIEYKYCVVENLNSQEVVYEILHEDGHVNRVLNIADFRDASERLKYDGYIKFENTKGKRKKGIVQTFKKFIPKFDWLSAKKDELTFYQAQNLAAFEHYAVELSRSFTKTMAIDWLWNQWLIVVRTLTFVKWRETWRNEKEIIGRKLFLESSLKCFYSLYERHFEPGVGECESFEALMFKLSTLIFLSCHCATLETLEKEQWEKHETWLVFRDEKTRHDFSELLLSRILQVDTFFEFLRDRCQAILKVGSEKNLKFTANFHVFFEWAFLDDSPKFLKIPPELPLRKETCETVESVWTNAATNRHLLIMAILSNSNLGFLKDKKMDSSHILSCLHEVWTSRQILPQTFLQLLNSRLPWENSCVDLMKSAFNMSYAIMSSVIKNGKYLHYRENAFFINGFLSYCLDLLSVVDSTATEEDMHHPKSNFCEAIAILSKECNLKDKYDFTDVDIFYWANLLRLRKGYSQKSIEFIENVIKKQLLYFLHKSYRAQNSLPYFCVKLPDIVKTLNEKRWNVTCYKELNVALDEALIASIFSRVSSYTTDVNFLIHLDSRPMVAEAFCKAVYEKFPQINSDESSFEIVVKNLDYQLISMILELMEKRNEVVQRNFGSQVNTIREAFLDVSCQLESGDITAKQFGVLSQKRTKFGALCLKLRVFDQKTVTSFFERIDSVYVALSRKVRELSKLIELTNKFESCEVEIDITEFKVLHKEWETYPLSKFVKLQPDSTGFSIVQEFLSVDDVCAIELFRELMESQIFAKFATNMLKASFQKSDNAFTYRHFLTVEMVKVQDYYLQQADSLASGHLSLNQAKQLFRSCSNDKTKLNEMDFFFSFLRKLAPNPALLAKFDGTVEIRKKQLKEIDSLGKSVAFMRALRKLVDLLEIRNLNNDFNQLEKLENLDSFQVCHLTPELLSCNEEFSDVTELEIKAIEAFVEQPAFLTWIRLKMKTLQELTVVAELASLSAGEIAYDIERVKFFHDAVFGYAPFIYDLNTDSDLNAVREAYKKVFSKLSKDGKLPEKYADSARHQSWFEKALETQGSVEKSSLEKALLINKSGEYSISYKPSRGNDKVLISVEDVISLKYGEKTGSSSENNEDLKERNLTLSELRDLLSRLMLIVGREKHEQTQNVDTFITTFQNIERLAAAFVVLFNSGCSFFQNWRALVRNQPGRNEPSLEIHFGGRDLKPLHGFCGETNADLSDLCSILESIKVKWQDYVFRMRNKHPILNQFNVQQLKVISASLAKAKRTLEPVEEVAVYYMRSLNDKLIALDIQRFIDESGEENEMEVDNLDEDMDVDQQDDVSNLAKITDEACVDKRSQILSIISSLKEELGDNEALAKAAVQATDAKGYDDALNWIIDNQEEEDIIETLAAKFDDYYNSLQLEETETESSLINIPDAQSVHREFSSKLEKLFDGYLLDLKENALSDFMNLHQVGRILSRCTKEQTLEDNSKRMPGHLKPGRPHLIICEKRKDLLPQVLSLYRFGNRQRLPDYSQVLLCNSRTTIQELEVFLLRSTLDPECRVYSIAFADDLSANCADHLEKFLFEAMTGNTNEYNLVVFCCDESSQVSVILEKHKSKLGCESDEDLRNYICENLRTEANRIDDYRARLVTSSQPSSGKSLHIDRLEERMDNGSYEKRVVLRLYDRKINFEKVLDVLWGCRKIENPVILHFDVSSNVLENVDELIFKLCILGGITDDRGKLFLVRDNFFVALEMLEPQDKSVWGHLCAVLPTTSCLSPNQCLNNANEMLNIGNQIVAADNAIINTDDFQRPHQYLNRIDTNQDVSNYTFETGRDRADPNVVIRTLKQWSGLRNPTWAQLSNFSRFLNEQLESCEKNFFVNAGDFPGFKNFLIRHCLVKMAQDFALPSLSISDNSPLFGLEEHQRNYEVHQIRRRWENHPHPYVFFNADMTTFTFLGVRVHNSNLLDSNGHVLAHNVMTPDLEQQIKRQAYDEPHILGEHFDNLPKEQKFTKLCRVLGVENEMKGRNVDVNYELTQDNVMKLLAIHMRFRCDIPVIIMGETGCGKTRLIEYLCLLIGRGKTVQNKKIVKVHGGVTVDDIVRNVEEAEALAKENTRNFGSDFYTVLFFDEANTTEAIYAIKEVVCDFSVNGRKLDPNSGLKIIVACNPYRKHDQKMIKKLESQGLGYHVKSSETEDKLDSDIPMRHLVYRVNPLPPSLLPLVWDFGQLTSQVEDKYIKQIVVRHAPKFNLDEKDTQFVCEVLSISQKFLRENRDQCLFVSLRDIERALSVLGFFHSKREKLLSEMDVLYEEQMIDEDDADEALNELARLMILTLGVCYHSSLEERLKYRNAIARAFNGDYRLPNGAKSILKELELCQQVFVRNLHLDEKANIAKNLALSENVFMMIICIQLRIPLFLVGKPGSSKSLAKTIVIDAMQGGSSRNEFFKLLKQVQMLSFQCSPHTNAEGIVSTFKQAALYQKGKDLESFVSVVVLDEIGLAEDSPKMPLKTLHPLLEEGYVEDGQRNDFGKVGFVGISNWALDPAKMNRGILVSRAVPKSKELIKSAQGICRVKKEGKPLEKFIQPLSDAYEEIYKAQIDNGNPEYFGLRDFYGLLKMLHREFMRNNRKSPSWSTVQSAIRRNFGEKNDGALHVFVKHLKKDVFETCRADSSKTSTLSLVEDNMKEADKRAELPEDQRSMDNESRYLLLMTENFSALQLLPQVLNLKNCEIIFGSSFPQDQEYIQVCKNINRIKVCMEMGTTVVLLNLGSLYESLYDALNQYYVYYGGKRFVDLGLGSNRVKCSVSEKFRLIMIEEEKVALKFPIPLLNRLEKHFLGMESILGPNPKQVREKICENLEKFANVPRQDSGTGASFTIRDAFVGYQEDTTACVVMQAKTQLESQEMNDEADLYDISLDNIFQTCTKEAMIRAIPEQVDVDIDHVKSLYERQGRKNLSTFLWKQFYCNNPVAARHLVEVTTFCRIPSHNDIKSVNRELMEIEGTLATDDRHAVINLNVFETEHEFVDRVKDFVRRSRKHKMKKVLFVTCAKGDRFVSLIACVKYSLQNLFLEIKDANLYILFLVQLPRYWYKSNYSSFSVGQWTSFHVDKLLVEEEIESMMEVTECQGSTLKDLFVLQSGECSKFQRKLLRDVVYEAVADSRSPGSDKLQRVSNVFRLFAEHHDPSLEVIFLNKAATFMDNECGHDKELKKWMAEKASNLHELIQNGDLENALFHELKQRVKPHLAEFLQTIDFNNNVRLLFENTWCKRLWMELFSLKEISRARILNKRENTFDSLFPFSAEIIAKMEQMWPEALEHCHDQNMEPKDYFVYSYENQVDELWNILRDVSLEESAVDSFLHDLIYHEFAGTASCIKKEQNKFIRKSILLRMGTKPNSLALAFALFTNLKPEIAAVAPVLRSVSCKKLAPSETAFKTFVVQTALDNLSNEANDLELTKSDIGKFVQHVQMVKMSSEDSREDPDFNLKLQKLSIFSTFLREVCHGLDEEMTQEAAKGAKTIWTSVRAGENIFGTKKLVSRLSFCLKKSLDNVLKVCLTREFRRHDCAFCRKDVTGKGLVPFLIPCQRNHVVHQTCWDDKMKALRNQEGNATRDGDFKCLHCNEEINREILLDAVANEYTCNERNSAGLWKQFSENICKVFINLVKDHFVENCAEDAAAEILQLCLFFNEDSQQKLTPYYVTSQSKQALVTIFAQNNPGLLNDVFGKLINDDITTSAFQINCSKTLDLLLAVFECVFSNDGFPHHAKTPPKFIMELQRIVRLKIELGNFCDEIVEAVNHNRRVDFTIPRSIREFLTRGKPDSVAHLKNLFIRTMCLDHGMNFYAEVKKVPVLHNLVPQELLNTQGEDFTDIFLVIPEYPNTVTEFVKGITANPANAIAVLGAKQPLMTNLIVYRYLLDSLGREVAPQGLQVLLEALQNRSLHVLENIVNPNNRVSPHNHRSQNLEQHFLFLLQTVFSTQQNVGILDPLKNIALNRNNEATLYLPTFPDSVQRNMGVINNVVQDFTTWNTCPNGHHYLIGNCGQPNAPGVCPDCGAAIGGGQHRYNPNNRLLGNRGTVPGNINAGQVTGYQETAANSRNFERKVTSFTGNVMRAFLHAALFLKSPDNNNMVTKLIQNVDIISRSALNVSHDNVWKFLVHILVTAPNQQLLGSFQSEDAREQWEDAFSTHVAISRGNLNTILQRYDNAFKQDCRNEFNRLPIVLYGPPVNQLPSPRKFDEDLIRFEKFWARSPKVALATFEAQVNADKDRHPLLSALMEHEVVESLRNIPTFLHVFKEIMKHFNIDESHKMLSIKDFLDDLPLSIRETITDGVRLYIKTWNELMRYRLEAYPTIKCLFKDRLSMDAPIRYFLPTRHFSDCCALVTMNFLVSKNNELVEKYRRVCNIETPVIYLEEGNVGVENVVHVSDLKRDLLSVVVTFTTQDLNSNTTRVVHDFGAIERTLGARLCAFKPLIRMKIMPLMSKSNSTKSALNNARPLLKEMPLSRTEAEKISRIFAEMPEVCKALRQLVLLMKYLEKDYSEEEHLTIADFMKNKLKLDCLPAIGNYDLNQTVALWQHLSLKKTYLMMDHTGEDPYPDILDEFKEQLDMQHKQKLGKMNKDRKKKLLIMLNEFIVLNLNEPDLMKPEFHIETDCLDIYFDEETELKLPDWMQLKHAEDVIKFLIEADSN